MSSVIRRLLVGAAQLRAWLGRDGRGEGYPHLWDTEAYPECVYCAQLLADAEDLPCVRHVTPRRRRRDDHTKH
jgi:hypothetical protein